MAFHSLSAILGVSLLLRQCAGSLAGASTVSPYNYTVLVPTEPGMVFAESTASDVRFFCISPRNMQMVQIFQNDPNMTAKIDVRRPIAFVVHGWMDGFFSGFLYANGESWPVATIQDWVRFVDTTACGVDWSTLSAGDYVRAARRNTRLAAYWLARLLVSLSAVGLPLSRVTISGHSLGAHVAGFTGKNVQAWTGGQRLATIFGLDPAGPLFTFPLPSKPANILQPGDADFVQVLHTSAFTFGVALGSGLGDAMFVANGGVLQPNCLFNSTTFGIEVLPFLCSHLRAVQFFRSSLNPRHRFVGRRCDMGAPAGGLLGLLGLWPKLCASALSPATPMIGDTDLFGIYTQRKRGVFELRTTGSPPFCIDC